VLFFEIFILGIDDCVAMRNANFVIVFNAKCNHDEMLILSRRKLIILIVLKLYLSSKIIISVMVMQWYSLNMQQKVLIVHA
jgi:hypothetical protein